jgi:tetratricopeptide (TPR) repeat protein
MTEAAALLQLANQARNRGHYAEALAHLQALPDEVRGDFQILTQEAELYCQLGDHDSELGLYDRLIDGWPDAASVWLAKANALKIVGRTDDAVAAARHAIAVQSTYGKAWWVLGDLKTYQFSDDELAAMQRAVEASANPEDRLHLHFALGKAWEDRREAAKAFQNYAQGNALRMQSVPATATTVTRRVDQAIQLFTADFLKTRAGQGFASAAPIFIIGLPRSGTTLIEQILASHPEIEGVGELNVISQLRITIATDETIAANDLISRIKALDVRQRAALGESYIEQASAFRSTRRAMFVDKMPTNWLNVGLIRLILPNARIIDARRHPMASGFSNFRQNYGQGAGWSYSLETIGQYYRDYLRLMRHFDDALPGWAHRVINERLIEDFEPEVRRLLDYVGVGFDPACLEFHRSNRPVRSASAQQVRQPINRMGVDQWRAFEPWLGPLKDALGPALEDWRE